MQMIFGSKRRIKMQEWKECVHKKAESPSIWGDSAF